MDQGNGILILRLGEARLRFVGLDKIQKMRNVWDEKRHSNAQWELHIILDGACRVDLEDQQWEITAGGALLIAPGQYHRPKALPGAFERLSLTFFAEGEALSNQLNQQCPGSLKLQLGEAHLRLGREILREHDTSRAFRQACLDAMVTQFAVEILRLLKIEERGFSHAVVRSKTVTTVIDDYFEAHFADSAGEEALAELLHVSRRQLVRILQENYGMNFRQKLIQARMDYAGWLLRTTDVRISQICSTVGYSSEAAFFKTFRQQFGMTPNQYRIRR